MDLERRLREQLKTEARQVEASPDAWARVRGRLGPRSRAPRRLILVLGTAAAVAVAVWVVSSQRSVNQNLIDTPPSRGVPFNGYWPVKSAAAARDIQQRVDDGEESWHRDPESVAREYVESLGWTWDSRDVPTTDQSGSADEGWTATTTIVPLVGEGSNRTPGPRHTVQLVGLPGAEEPAWFVAGIVDENITVDYPQLADKIQSPLQVEGSAHTFEGNVLVTVVDDLDRPLGGAPVTGGGDQKRPFTGSIGFTKEPSTKLGLVKFEGGSGLGGPSTDVTIVRVEFGEPSDFATPSPTAAAAPSQVDRTASPTEPDMAFLCFFDGVAARSLDEAKRCMTDRFIAGTDKAEFECCSSPVFDRAVIIKSYPQNGTLLYDAVVYWRDSTGLSSSGNSVTITREGEHWLVDAWDRPDGMQRLDDPISVTFSFIALGDTPRCDADGQPTPDSFVSVTRDVPDATGADLVLTVVREILTGPWADEDDGASPFPSGTRVESVDVEGDDVHVNLTNTDYRPSAACDHSNVALTRTLRTLPGFENANVTISTP
jgi:hypothetical protein